MLWELSLVVFTAGCVGGLVNGLLSGEIVLPHFEKTCGTYFPGIVGNVILGGVGALVFWGLYGPLATLPVISSGVISSVNGNMALSLGDLLGSLVVGIGGGRLLTGEAERRCLRRRLGET